MQLYRRYSIMKRCYMKIQIFDGMSVDLSSFLKTWFFIYRDFFHWRIYYKKDEAKLGIFQQDRFERIYDHQIKHYNMERWWSVTTPVAWSTTTKSRWKADRLFKANSTGTSNTQRKWKSAEEKFCLAGWSLVHINLCKEGFLQPNTNHEV